jgi:hypothetical protein
MAHQETRIEGSPASAHGPIRIVALTTTEVWSLTIDSRFIEGTENAENLFSMPAPLSDTVFFQISLSVLRVSVANVRDSEFT